MSSYVTISLTFSGSGARCALFSPVTIDAALFLISCAYSAEGRCLHCRLDVETVDIEKLPYGLKDSPKEWLEEAERREHEAEQHGRRRSGLR